MKKVMAILGFFAVSYVSAQKTAQVEVQPPPMDVSASIAKDKIELYNQSFLKFVDALKKENQQEVYNLISDKVKNRINENVIRALSGGISFERNTEVYQSGYQKLLDNQTYPAIQYKYSDDMANPPKDLITVIFENDGKILGIKPEYSK